MLQCGGNRAALQQHPSQLWMKARSSRSLSADGANDAMPRSTGIRSLTCPIVALIVWTSLASYTVHRAYAAPTAADWVNSGLAKAKIGDRDSAIADYTHAIETGSGLVVAYAYLNRGLMKRAKQDFPGAIADYAHAIDLAPDLAPAYLERSAAEQAQGNLKAALADSSRAIELDPEIARAYDIRGTAEARLDPAAAVEDYDRAIALDPALESAYANRAQLEISSGKLDAAIADFTQAIELNRNPSLLARVHQRRGAVRLAKGDVDGAISDTTRAIELDPRLADAYTDRGTARQTKGDVTGAITDFTRAIDLDPTGRIAYFNRGNAKQIVGDFFGAIVDYGRAIELSKIPPAAYYESRGNAKVKAGDVAGAIADYNTAIKLDPKLENAYDSLAWELATAKDPSLRDGKRALELALKLCAFSGYKNASHLATLAAAYARVGDFSEAVAWQQKVLEDPRLAAKNAEQEHLRLYRLNKAWPPD